MRKMGFTAFDKTGYAVRNYIATRMEDAKRAADMELGETFGHLHRVPLNVVRYNPDPILQPADLTTNSGWAELTAA